MAEKPDIVNERVNAAQAEIAKRAVRLEKIVKRPGQKNAAFKEGAKLVAEMIENQSKLLDTVVFDAPKTYLEQTRNLGLATGGIHTPIKEGMSPATDAIDSMLDILDEMSKTR